MPSHKPSQEDSALAMHLAELLRKERNAPMGEHIGMARARTNWTEQTIPERWRQNYIMAAACAMLAKEERTKQGRSL